MTPKQFYRSLIPQRRDIPLPNRFRAWLLSPVLGETQTLKAYLAVVLTREGRIVADLSVLQAALDALKANVDTQVIPLLQKVAQGSTDQATVDAMAAEAQGILGSLTSNEPPTPSDAPTA